jgi:hypothetical protein
MRRKYAASGFIRFVFAIMTGFLIGAACAQNNEASSPIRPWVNQPSAALAAKFEHWRLKFEPGEPVNAPEKGAFPSFARAREGTVRVVSDLGPSARIRLTPVTGRTRYVPPWDPRTDAKDKFVTKEIVDVLESDDVARFIAAEHVNDAFLDVERNFSVALVQEFDAALRTPKKKEHVWSLNWRIDNEWIGTRNEKNEWTAERNDRGTVGFEGWGVFTKMTGALKPFHLAAAKYEYGGHPYYYVLAAGDLDGDGIDELVVKRVEFEAEQDNLEIWAWEHGGPVTIDKLP